jgi:hypothetical protein
MDRLLIRTTPKVTPTKIAIPDLDNAKDKDGNRISFTESSGEGQAVKKGSSAPIILIGGIKLPEDMVLSFTVWQHDLLPQIALTIKDIDGIFASGLFPVADPIISIFLRSTNDKLKSLSGDYLIVTAGSAPVPGTSTTIYTFSGELHVPKINGNFSKSYKNMTSLEVLKKVADDLQLGFADNQPQNTNDRMTWLMPNYTYKSFINDIKKVAYRNDDSFFDCFIDRYYILNFVNVEKMLTQEPETEKGLLALEQSVIDQRRISETPETTENQIEQSLILNNHPGMKGSELYINNYSLTSHHGEILVNHAIRKHVYWYEHGRNTNPDATDDVNFRDQFLEPLQTPVKNDGKAPQTANIDEFKKAETLSGVWIGVDYANAHRDYKFAGVINKHNLLEIKKNLLHVSLSGININIIRGSRVSVLIYMSQTSARSAASARATLENQNKAIEEADLQKNAENDKGQASMAIDKALSGFYYVAGIKYSYFDNSFETELILTKRNWLLPRPKNDLKF